MLSSIEGKRSGIALIIIFLPLLYFFEAVIGKLALVQGDGWTASLGLRIYAGSLIWQGVLPLWNPYIFSGMPLLASIYPGSLYPPNWIFAFLPPALANNIVVITTYHLAIIGTYRYVRTLGIGRTEALISGTIFAFGGYMVMAMGQTATIATSAWLPWILLATEKLYQKATWHWVALGSIFIALQFFGGVPQMTWYTVLVGGAYFLFSVTLRKPLHSRLRFSRDVSLMALCGILLSAIQLLPLRELQQQSGRARISYEYFSAYSFPPAQILALIFPYFYGGATFPPYKTPFWGEWGIFVTCGYVGFLGLLLGLIGVMAGKRNCLVLFWLGGAILSLILSFGHYLPFGLNHLLYHIPIYNLFRGSFRHMFEFTFSCSVLAGFGLSYLNQREIKGRFKLLKLSAAVTGMLILCALFVYRFGGKLLTGSVPQPSGHNSLANTEILIPLSFFIISVATLWLYARNQSRFTSALMIFVLMADLMAYGYFLDWRAYKFNVAERLADSPTVKYIKDREPDHNAFRVMSYAVWPWENYEILNYPNNSIVRGLRSANGYDMLCLTRPTIMMGDMSSDGVIQDLESFGVAHQGLNLFNVKYLLVERNGALGIGRTVEYEGIRFREKPLELKLVPGSRQQFAPGGVTATEIAVVSTMSNSAHLQDRTPIVKVSLYAKDGQVIVHNLQIGRDTSEWAYDRADVRGVIKHQRAGVVESWPVTDATANFEGHRYLARFSFTRTEIESVELEYVNASADISVQRVSLYNSANKLSYSLDSLSLPTERWQKLTSFGQIDLYENLKSLPQAWFVNQVTVLPDSEVLKVIKSGNGVDGREFDPRRLALLDSESYRSDHMVLSLPTTDVNAEVSLTTYESQKIELRTHNAQAGFLVLSEVYYPGWEAQIDGEKVKVYRANYALRGIVVPPGKHKIEFFYDAPSFKRGAIYSGVGILLLLSLALLGRARRNVLRN